MDQYSFSAEGRQSTKQRRIKELNSDEDIFHHLPENYAFNSNKEELCLEYVRNFYSKFTEVYPNREQLFMVSPNEYGVEKFLPTTIRPTLLPFRDVYDAEKTAEFVANYLEYEPLEDPTQPPSCLPSPAQVINWGVGDSFDFAMVLASILLGAGYDAFVVYGYAPRWICLRDQSQTTCPLVAQKSSSPDSDQAGKEESKLEPNGTYERPLRPAPVSKYDAEEKARQEREAKAKADYLNEWLSDEEEDLEEEGEFDSDDPLSGKRLHAWVLLRGGKREFDGIKFIEPTTGRMFNLSEAPYLSVEAIWNAKNYFINMQEGVPVSSLCFDTLDSKLWEFVFIDPMAKKAASMAPPQTHGGAGEGESKQADPSEAKQEELDEADILDIPPSWVTKLSLDRHSFKLKYPPTGQRCITYHKAKLEMFANHLHPQGTVTRLTLYKDRAQTVVKEIRESFLDRRDLLHTRARYPLESKTVEEFLPGRPGAIHRITEWTGRRREIAFYVSARLDGLVSREEDVGSKIIERFEGRPDRMVYRSLSVSEDRSAGVKAAHTLPGHGGQDLAIQKMAIKFERNRKLPANQDIQKRTFYLKEGRIRTQYHYAEGRITRETTNHFKDKYANSQHMLEQTAVGARSSPDSDQAGLQAVLSAERECLQEVRRAHAMVMELLKTRMKEEASVAVDLPIFERASEKRGEEKGGDLGIQLEEQVDSNQVDYLTPFLQNVVNPARITHEEAQRAREACLKSLKDRLLERANIIQNRLNEENAKLSKRQATFQRNASRENDPAAEEEFEKFCSEAMFRIQILEQRLVSHEETALKKYQDLDEKLSSDPRLAVLANS